MIAEEGRLTGALSRFGKAICTAGGAKDPWRTKRTKAMAAKKTKTIELAASKPFNEHRKGLFMSAGNAGAPITVDTRRRAIRAHKGKGSYSRREKHAVGY